MSQESTNGHVQKWTTFYLASMDRDYILERYTFYVTQARELIFPHFADIEGAAHRHSDKWYEEAGLHFNPDVDDVGAIAEQAYHEGINYGLMLDDMQADVYLAILSGLYHRWDKDLRAWVVKELQHWIDRERIEHKIWEINLPTLIELLESLGITITSQPFYPLLVTYGNIVNVYKHGSGKSFMALRNTHPEYFRRNLQDAADWKYTNHDDLVVSEDQLNALVDTLYAFWHCIPVYTSSDDAREEIPRWFIKIIEAD
ncbi:hypothetical protein DDT52_16455 [Brenneria roseae subsp. roseae]|uniref:hypothetical protein n=1 Tax=Brenneria roseae TaxID=1509241 RepID=UPI000D621FCB|nr:hypothetical protein [Brenneria roseae]PWC17131.1 hypothetical protein DDT52_16455 [Brenneria roseae subsp. roseae]